MDVTFGRWGHHSPTKGTRKPEMRQGWAHSDMGQTEGDFSWETGLCTDVKGDTAALEGRPACRGLREAVRLF